MMTWFASRPIAQARAAALTTLLPWPDDPAEQGALKTLVVSAIRGMPEALAQLATRIGNDRPRVLDMFSGRGIIPLEAARAGAEAWGIDYNPVATLGGFLLADYPFRDWSAEPPLPFGRDRRGPNLGGNEKRLLCDVEDLLAEVADRHEAAMDEFYPRNQRGERPWGYLWARAMPCANCGRPFPLVGSAVLRYPGRHGRDPGQCLRLAADRSAGRLTVEVCDGTDGTPTFVSAAGGGRGAKVARCPFCGHSHSAGVVKAQAADGALRDTLLLAAEDDPDVGKRFRVATDAEQRAAAGAEAAILPELPFAPGLMAVPDEPIPPGNHDIVRASLYGARTYGDLCCTRQTLAFVRLCRIIRDLDGELANVGIGDEYRRALLGYAGSVLVRKIRRATRGATFQARNESNNRVYVHDVFTNQASLRFSYDFFEAGIGHGPGTLRSLSEDTALVVRRLLEGVRARPARIRQGSALRLPFSDGTVDAIITDPPYYELVAYTDASDIFYVWLKRALGAVYSELFDTGLPLQPKDEEMIVKREQTPGEHRTAEFYRAKLAEAFRDAKRVLKRDGSMTLVFGHGDPEAWVLLLGALRDEGFLVSGAWPARTESEASGGGANIKVTVTIACRVAPQDRPAGLQATVDHEVARAVAQRVHEWERDGLALVDQLMASCGPAMEVLGRYQRVIQVRDGQDTPLLHYLALARRAVQDAADIKVDGLPLETFDARTRFALFWARLYPNRGVAPKSEAVFQTMAAMLNFQQVREGILEPHGQKGYRLAPLGEGPARPVDPETSVYDVLGAMVRAWRMDGGLGVAAVLARCGRGEQDAHLWAAVAGLPTHLKPGDPDRRALEDISRNRRAILVGRAEMARRPQQLRTAFDLEPEGEV